MHCYYDLTIYWMWRWERVLIHIYSGGNQQEYEKLYTS